MNIPYINNKKIVNKRSPLLLALFSALFLLLSGTLFNLQIIKGQDYASVSAAKKTRTLTITGVRGKILDTNGNPLALDERAFNLEFYREYNTIEERPQYTKAILQVVRLLQKSGKSIENTFAISKNEKGQYVLNFGSGSAAVTKEKRWRADFFFKETDTPEAMYKKLRERYKLPAALSDEEAFLVLAIWQDSIQNYYVSRSIVVARDISEETVAEIESYSYELMGFNIAETSVRSYPQSETAAHLVGYMGRIDSKNVQKYVKDMGYAPDALVGVYGIESIMEDYLTGNGTLRSGKRMVEVAASGRILRELSYSAPSTGDNVYLTIDINLQTVIEDALAANIATINTEQQRIYQENLAAYQATETLIGRKIKFATTGAAIVMDVNTGAILAMASYPSYDPNLFAGGISLADYEALLADKRNPLFNRAISSADTPGSIFKMVTGIAGLMEGKLQIDETITDLGEYTKYVEGTGIEGPMCWYYRAYHRNHGTINVVDAIKVSCNYFFYEVADRIGVGTIHQWAENFGLLSKTGIELVGETQGQVGGQQVIYDKTKNINDQQTSLPYLAAQAIRQTILDCAAGSNVTLTEAQVVDAVNRMMQLVGTPRQESLKAIRSILVDELKLSRSLVDKESKFHINDYLIEITWTPTNTLMTGIGQDITTVTPIGIARYLSTIVNGGYVYNAYLVDKVVDSSGKTVYKNQPTVFKNLTNVNKAYYDAMKEGMRDCVSGDDSSTANNYFKNFKYKNQMGGKTGTAQVNKINLENNSWFIAFAPYDKPEVAIVVYIPNGYSGGMSSPTAKAAVEYYLNQKNKVESDAVTGENTLVN